MQTKLINAEVELGHRPGTWRIQSSKGAVPKKRYWLGILHMIKMDWSLNKQSTTKNEEVKNDSAEDLACD